MQITGGLEHIPKRYRWIVGIDEAGRGPVAGPLCVGLTLMERPQVSKLLGALPMVRDSKKLSAPKRKQVLEEASQGEIEKLFAVQTIFSDAEVIDSLGISYCLQQSISEGLERLLGEYDINPKQVFVYLDGALKAPGDFAQQTVVGGDNKIFAIALASIYAKERRDQQMEDYDLEYPNYDWYHNKGYGTQDHMKRIKEFGLSPVHRKTFLKKFKQ